MAEHWTDRNKHMAKDGFAEALDRKVSPEQVNNAPQGMKPPQPMLTPNGPMRSAVDQQVRERIDAEIAQRQEAIRVKFAKDCDREKPRGMAISYNSRD
ncbi:hypothetical protein [Hyphococcus sp.]|uniref:hypothetical protein n=1 Tax=Hyphococcus sp. TaxID=2038636 RepID=UPI003D0C0D1E